MRAARTSFWVLAWIIAAGPAAAERATMEADEMSPQTFVEIYRQALAAPTDHEAIEKLAAAEARFPGESPDQAAKRLTRTELDVARALARRDLETLVPVMLLHHDLAVTHKRQRSPLVHHATQIVSLLADFYAREGASEGSRRTAAGVLTSLGAYLQTGGMRSSLKLFERALQLEPGKAPALLGLAMHYEKRGGPYERVVTYLERLHEANPEHREGRLRLAINQLRLEHEENAVGLLEGLLESEESDWIYSLAAQELARFHARETDTDRAIQVLDAAVERRPEDQNLKVQLAFFYDRNLGSHTARKLTADLGTEGPAEPVRALYNRWPDSSLARIRDELRQSVQTRMPALAEALAATQTAEE